MQAILEWVKLRHYPSPKLVSGDVVAIVKSTAPFTTWVLFPPPPIHNHALFLKEPAKAERETLKNTESP